MSKQPEQPPIILNKEEITTLVMILVEGEFKGGHSIAVANSLNMLAGKLGLTLDQLFKKLNNKEAF